MRVVKAVSGKKDLKLFIDFPHSLYAEDPNYVPELFIAQRDLLTPGKHPFFKHSAIALFLLLDDDQVVGRIAAIENMHHNKVYQSKDGFFGFFECINDVSAARQLINTVHQWLETRQMTKVLGPVNFSTNEVCGLLIEGFNGPPVAMMPYNPPYYLILLEALGYTKNVDLRAYRYTAGDYSDRSLLLIDRIKERLLRKDITIRTINMKNFAQERDALRLVYNKAWDKNLGFVPMTDEEFEYTANDLKLILDPKFCIMAEQHGKIVGFALAIPDINQILIKIKKGRLFPTGLIRLLTGKGKIDGIRIMLLGVVDGYRKMGIEACLYGGIIKRFQEKKMKYAEASWTLDHNDMVNRPIEDIGGKLYRKYRILEREL
ncbi:hypothetical protein DU508_16415 [Pedobacter chinensis]|uniref:N-acetyltransferase domain-containing protein n=1 Tax=Pedobacter chinensis TaxID=2282421 RepID=A0A369PTE6_9SPHI|nr:hypothetical protein [Pedobacter chinensis]RDC55843.1 hypothetical protein DU508_16415 [Pedobacter chinensis]